MDWDICFAPFWEGRLAPKSSFAKFVQIKKVANTLFRSYHSWVLGLVIFCEVNDMIDLLVSFFNSDTAAMWVTALATIGLLVATIVLAKLTLLLARASSDPQICLLYTSPSPRGRG